MTEFKPYIRSRAWDKSAGVYICWLTAVEWDALSVNMDVRRISFGKVICRIAHDKTTQYVWLVPDRKRAISESLECANHHGLWGTKWRLDI